MQTKAPLLAMVVDDDPDFRRILQVILEQAGYRVAEASNGREALELFPALCPDVMLVDVNMPIMDGLELCRRIRSLKQGRTTPFLLITVRSRIDVLKEGVDSGASDYILKPFGPEDLLSRVARAIDECRNG